MAGSSNFWSAQGLTHLTIGLNIASFVFYRNAVLEKTYSVSQNNTLAAMMVSMFTHLNAEHLLSNMLSLLFTSLSVFVDPQWNSPWTFLCIYIPSGLAGFMGNSLLVHRMQNAWTKRQERKQLSLSTESLSNWVTSIWNGEEYRNVHDRYTLYKFAAAKRIGASGAVYGVVGARIYTAIWSPYHAPLSGDDLKALLCLVADELPRVSWSLESLATTESMVDHAAHLFGFVTGMACSWMWDKWSCYRQQRTKRTLGRYNRSSKVSRRR